MAANDVSRSNHGDPTPRTKNAIPPEQMPTNTKMVKATVARGKSVMISTGRRVVGFHPHTEEPIYGPILEYVDELTEIELPESDVLWMRPAGYLIDPEAKPVQKSEGPSFTEVRGNVVQATAYAR